MPTADNIRLVKTRVHIGGAGRVGTAVALALHAARVGCLSVNDPQTFEEEQFAWCAFSRRSDLGRPKVHVLERFFDGRPGFVFEPVVAPNESLQVEPYLEQADVIVSCANQLSARLHLERVAVKLKKPSIQASVQDGRRALGGLVSAWVPGTEGCCFGCLFPRTVTFRRGEILSSTVTAAVGALAAQRVVELLNNPDAAIPNLLFIDLVRYAIESFSVRPRRGCCVCGG